MNKLYTFLVALLMTLLLANGAYCADGDELTTTSFRVNSDGQVVQKQLIEVAITNDTITAAETGKTILTNYNTSPVTYHLPTAAAGLKYTFTSINGHVTSGKAIVYLEPADVDTFVGCVNGTSTTSFAAGDSLYSPGATGDSVTIVGNTLYWYCTDRTGTWVDGNTTH